MKWNYSILIAAMSLGIAACGESNKSVNASSDVSTDNSIQQETTMSYKRMQQLDVPAPVAKQVPHTFEHHGISVDDPFNWLRDSSYPNTDDKEVLDYLNAENDYFQQFLAPNKELVDELFEEFKGRVDETASSVPYVDNGYEYWWEYKEGHDYRTRYRKNLETGKVEVYLDEQALSEAHDYFVIGGVSISPDNKRIAYTIDTSGDERYDVFVRDLSNDQEIEVAIGDTNGSVQFVGDSNTLVYGKLAEGVWRTESVNTQTIGVANSDRVLFAEKDTGFFLGSGLTTSEEYLIVSTGNSDAREVVVFDAKDLSKPGVTLFSREDKLQPSVDHGNGKFYVRVNDKHVNFRLASMPEANLSNPQWQSIIEGDKTLYVQGFKVFAEQMVVSLSREGLEAMHVIPNEGEAYDIEFPEKVYSVGLSVNPSFEQQHVRLRYTSMITPSTIYDYDFKTKSLTQRKQQKIPSGYDKSQYETVRLMAPARDGEKVPVSIVYKKGFKKDGSQPLSLYAYGAYGAGMSPSFSTTRLSLLDRGFAFAIAHTRGGDEMGYSWYLDGKMDERENAFNDFVDVAKHLVKEGYTSKGNISIAGGSAGGEMMGAVTIQAPEMWRSVSLMVPFVDVLNTMLDATLPLTPPEWNEWGNPIESKHYFELIKSYSPYDNIEKREYPPMLVTGGLNDPRVTYWEPAKWTAKMRALKTDDNLLIMRMNMGAGHFANSGRYGRLMDRAEEMAFQILAHREK
ncbi:S9 family peptidase [Psychrosphaera ytuae]|nr:S9 family peptidase [Psychrosphaera ytuae]